jgi:hypothetical protein
MISSKEFAKSVGMPPWPYILGLATAPSAHCRVASRSRPAFQAIGLAANPLGENPEIGKFYKILI